EFGLGAATMVDEIQVLWPSGLTATYTSVPGNQRVVYTEDATAVGGTDQPTVSGLRGNYPNPFHPTTARKFDLSAAGAVDLRFFDLGGRLVRKLRSGEQMAAGAHAVVWNGRDDQGQSLASGLYFCRLEAAGMSETRKMTLLK
ncbi:MAG: hypothetical protein GY835_22020, partial [bacterium]|nr:hypothetical protein [bacterium]